MAYFKGRSHFLIGASLGSVIRVLINNKFRISLKYLPKLALIIFFNLLTYPLILLERAIYSRKIKKEKLSKDPVFIIGHCRSGTTYMHNLFSQDKQFTFPSSFQCFMPGMFLLGNNWLKTLARKLMPEKRVMDNVKIDVDLPQEDEFGLMNMSSLSFYQALIFPKASKTIYTDLALLKNKNSESWKKDFLFFLKKVSYSSRGKQIVSKNPVNIVRIKILLALYPKAKFIYMHRYKEQVLNSTFNLYQKLLDVYSLQKVGNEEIENNVIYLYDKIIAEYELQKRVLDADNLVEVFYEDLIRDPFKEVESIYTKFKLDGFENAKPDLLQYIESQRSYVPNSEIFFKK